MHSDLPPVANLAVIILTYNEELNLPYALASIQGWAAEVFVLDSFSTDRTVEVAREAGCSVEFNQFENYSKQRSFALRKFPISSEWVLFLDADEWLPDELKHEITRVISGNPSENGFYIKFRLIWMGKWIKRGYYPSWILRLFRRGKATCEDRGINERMIAQGKTGRLQHDIVHEDRKGISSWIAKHNEYATREARELLKSRGGPAEVELDLRLFGSQAERKRWIRVKVWNRLPPLLRPFLYFFYRYILAGGILGGRAALVYHFMQALWFPMLIDAKYVELKEERASLRPPPVSEL